MKKWNCIRNIHLANLRKTGQTRFLSMGQGFKRIVVRDLRVKAS